MTTLTLTDVAGIEELDQAAIARVAGGMIPEYDDGTGNKARPGFPPEGALGGLDRPYWDSDGSFRYGAGPWDYGYGVPNGPFQAPPR